MTRFLDTTDHRYAIPVCEIERIDYGKETIAAMKNGATFAVYRHAVEELFATDLPAPAGQTVWVAHYNVSDDEGVDSLENDAPNGMFIYESPVIAWRLVWGDAHPVLPDGVLDSETAGRASTTRWAMQSANGTVVDCGGTVFSNLESFKRDYLADCRQGEAKTAAGS